MLGVDLVCHSRRKKDCSRISCSCFPLLDIERRKVAQRNGNGAVPTPSSPFSRTPTSPTPAIPLTPVAAAIEREFNTGLAIPPQVYIRCNFCGHAVAHNRLLIPGLGMVGKSPGGVGASAMTSRYMSAAGAGSPGDIGSGYSSPSGGMGGGGGGGSGMAPNHQRTKHIACPSCRKRMPAVEDG